MKRALFCFLLLFSAFTSLCPHAQGLTLLPDAEIYKQVRSQLKGQSDFIKRDIHKAGKKTIEFEAYISQDGDIKLAPEILSNIGDYGRWVLRGINKKPGGGSYYLQFRSLREDPPGSKTLRSDFVFVLPLLRKEMQRDFRMGTTAQKGDVFTLSGEALPNEKSPLEAAEGILRLYPAEGMPGRVWIYIKGYARLRNWLLYEALPERLMAGETGERIQLILDNYMAEEERLRALRAPASKNPESKPNRIPTEKTAAQAGTAATHPQK